MVKITPKLIGEVCEQARRCERKRRNYNFHPSYSDPLQRLLNALEPQTYIRPHKHTDDTVEIFLIVRGKLVVVEFDEKGGVQDSCVLEACGGNFGVEIAGGLWHTTVALKTGSAFFEVKKGPYDPSTAKIFASWSPEENSPQAQQFNQRILANLALIK